MDTGKPLPAQTPHALDVLQDQAALPFTSNASCI